MDIPLKPIDIRNLRKLIYDLQVLEQQISLANQAGLPVEEYIARHAHLKGTAAQMLATYEPAVQAQS